VKQLTDVTPVSMPPRSHLRHQLVKLRANRRQRRKKSVARPSRSPSKQLWQLPLRQTRSRVSAAAVLQEAVEAALIPTHRSTLHKALPFKLLAREVSGRVALQHSRHTVTLLNQRSLKEPETRDLVTSTKVRRVDVIDHPTVAVVQQATLSIDEVAGETSTAAVVDKTIIREAAVVVVAQNVIGALIETELTAVTTMKGAIVELPEATRETASGKETGTTTAVVKVAPTFRLDITEAANDDILDQPND